VSEATVRASAGDYAERQVGSTALERLASMVEEDLSDEEELILSWVSRWVPQRHIAEWLGISHGAARNRVMRLRARLKDIALQHAASFTGRERVELAEFSVERSQRHVAQMVAVATQAPAFAGS
jgi:hypothetical protein